MTSTIKVNTVKDTASTDIIKKCGTSITVGTASDTTTVAGNAVRSNALQASDGQNIISQTGTTITLGASGDTITLSAGANQTGFGRTGTVNWSTTPITATPTTGVNGVGYFINSSGGAKTVNLPASPSAGDIMAVSDYAQNAATNNITIGRNGSNIQGDASDLVIEIDGLAVTLVFVDATKGWIVTDTGAEADKKPAPSFICASVSGSGNTLTTVCTDYKIATFTGPGTFTVSGISPCAANNVLDYVVVGGAGSGPATLGGEGISGGGGAGGFRFFANTTTNPQSGPGAPLNNFPSGTSVTATVQGYPISIGGGGPSGQPTGSPGTNTTALGLTAAGGGRGGRGDPSVNGQPGGSGGGGNNGCRVGGTGNTPPTSPAQGTTGGNGGSASGAGGGGAIGVGQPSGVTGGPGGNGAGITGFGTTGQLSSGQYYFSGGGGGGNGNANFPSPGTAGSGGLGGGAPGKTPASSTVSNGTDNTGGGGGGANDKTPVGGGGGLGGNGGSGIVVIRYKFQ